MGKAPFEEIESAQALSVVAKRKKNTGEKRMIKSPFTSGLNSESQCISLHYLPGFYPSVEPRHDEAGNSRTRHLSSMGKDRNPSFTYISCIVSLSSSKVRRQNAYNQSTIAENKFYTPHSKKQYPIFSFYEKCGHPVFLRATTTPSRVGLMKASNSGSLKISLLCSRMASVHPGTIST